MNSGKVISLCYENLILIIVIIIVLLSDREKTQIMYTKWFEM